MFRHALFERHSLLLLVGILVVVAIGGLVEIAPLFLIAGTIEKVEGMRPYTPLELAGRDIYIREGCYGCHSQMIRAIRDEVERYGHYSLAAESMFDHPFQWGSKRTGPDLARVGGKFSAEWHVAHMIDPRAVVPESIMPGYPFLAQAAVDADSMADKMRGLRMVGVPYTDDMIADAATDVGLQINPDAKGAAEFLKRYPKAQQRAFSGNTSEASELDAMIAYLQMLGTLVDFAKYDEAGPNLR
jgi:cytochrome c oxidase cbb3-type subunit II